jgi:hypothetical protein
MRVADFDEATFQLARELASAGVQYVALEDDDDVALTIVPGPARRNLSRLAGLLRRRRARMAAPGPRLDLDALVHGGPARWPLVLEGDVAVDVMVVGVDDGRWAAYFNEARPVTPAPGVELHVVPDVPILRVRRGDAREAIPELGLTQRERDRLRLERRRAVLLDERRAARRATLRRLARRA